ncbi:MAG TPA: class I SAM-dependent methyltransferase [Solirubrobacteraceae bacterium]
MDRPAAASASHSRYLRLSARAADSEVVRSVYDGLKRASRPLYHTPYVQLLDRHELPLLFNARGLIGCGVEVGVQQGLFSQSLLNSWNGRHLISVDPWKAAEADYHDAANVTQEQHDALYDETVKRLAPFGERSSVWRMYGEQAAAAIPHHSMDFVYLDARHGYEFVMEDLKAWVDKVRPGGVLCGHDYMDVDAADAEFGVKTAVDEFFARRHQTVKVTLRDLPWRSWYVLV